jgi:hypothetical protein
VHTHLSRTTETFILRLWMEYQAQVPPAWRGEIVRVNTGERMYFASLGEMSEHLQRCASTQKQIKEQEDES